MTGSAVLFLHVRAGKEIRVFPGLVTLVFTKCEKQAPSELSFVRRARAGPNGVDWRALTVWDRPYRERRLVTTWEHLGRLYVRRARGG